MARALAFLSMAAAEPWQYHCPAGMNVSELQYDLQNRSFLVTGADGRLGYEVALAAAKSGARVVASCRSQEKADATKAKLEAESGVSVEALAMDLSSLASVREAAASVDQLDVLVNVAGVAGQDHVTADGFLATIQVNVVAPALLTELLMPKLQAADRPRVVYIGSAAQYVDMHSPSAKDAMAWSRGTAMAVDSYSFSKFLDVHYAKEQALRHPELTVLSVAPGYFRDPPSAYQCPTDLFKFTPCPQTPAQGATSTFFAAAQPGIEAVSGAMLDFETTHDSADYFKVSQDGDTCIPRELPRWDEQQRAEWYDAVQATVRPTLVEFV